MGKHFLSFQPVARLPSTSPATTAIKPRCWRAKQYCGRTSPLYHGTVAIKEVSLQRQTLRRQRRRHAGRLQPTQVVHPTTFCFSIISPCFSGQNYSLFDLHLPMFPTIHIFNSFFLRLFGPVKAKSLGSGAGDAATLRDTNVTERFGADLFRMADACVMWYGYTNRFSIITYL